MLLNTVHLVLKISGNEKKQKLFHKILGDFDSDLPWSGKKAMVECKKCGGLVYRMPRFGADDLKSLSRQICDFKTVPGHLKIKIKKFIKACEI